MKLSLVTCVITITILLSMACGKHLIIKTKDTTKQDTMKYARHAIHGKPFGTYGDYDLGATEQNEEIAKDDMRGEHLTPDDFMAAEFVNKTFDGYRPEFIQEAGLFEGDIILSDDQKAAKGQRMALRRESARWPDAKVPYIITGKYSLEERAILAKGMNEFHENSCIEFIPRTTEEDYIEIVDIGEVCKARLGRSGGKQPVWLPALQCLNLGTVLHELMHALGFLHEHQRPDRDEYITIQSLADGEITSKEQDSSTEKKLSLDVVDLLGAKYDLCSIMHYAPSWTGDKASMVAKKKSPCNMGQRAYFSDTDIQRLNTYYKCEGFKQVGSKPDIEKEKPCLDDDKNCPFGSIAKIDPQYQAMKLCRPNIPMLVKCPHSCEECGVTCGDKHEKCEQWAKAGDCSKEEQYMNVICPMACKRCKATCMDENSQCKSWAEKGDCNEPTLADYMRLRCRKSCKIC